VQRHFEKVCDFYDRWDSRMLAEAKTFRQLNPGAHF
jgi:hypothetical protein